MASWSRVEKEKSGEDEGERQECLDLNQAAGAVLSHCKRTIHSDFRFWKSCATAGTALTQVCEFEA
jgi:hypothetical protein